MYVPRPNFGRSAGFTLIEALIAFVILSVGLLGIVSLQSMAKTSQHLAVQHTRAVVLGDAIVERIRANPTGLGTYDDVGLVALGGGSRGEDPAKDCHVESCSPAELANFDLWAWEQALDGAGAKLADDTNTTGLIAPRGCIVFTPAPDRARTGLLSIIIQWRGLHKSSDAVQGDDAVCGDDYADEEKEYRRQVVINTYVVDETEF